MLVSFDAQFQHSALFRCFISTLRMQCRNWTSNDIRDIQIKTVKFSLVLQCCIGEILVIINLSCTQLRTNTEDNAMTSLSKPFWSHPPYEILRLCQCTRPESCGLSGPDIIDVVQGRVKSTNKPPCLSNKNTYIFNTSCIRLECRKHRPLASLRLQWSTR